LRSSTHLFVHATAPHLAMVALRTKRIQRKKFHERVLAETPNWMQTEPSPSAASAASVQRVVEETELPKVTVAVGSDCGLVLPLLDFGRLHVDVASRRATSLGIRPPRAVPPPRRSRRLRRACSWAPAKAACDAATRATAKITADVVVA
jgi:hypothetical protein